MDRQAARHTSCRSQLAAYLPSVEGGGKVAWEGCQCLHHFRGQSSGSIEWKPNRLQKVETGGLQGCFPPLLWASMC